MGNEQFKNLSAEEISGKSEEVWIENIMVDKKISRKQAENVIVSMKTNVTGWLVPDRKLKEKIPFS